MLRVNDGHLYISKTVVNKYFRQNISNAITTGKIKVNDFCESQHVPNDKISYGFFSENLED